MGVDRSLDVRGLISSNATAPYRRCGFHRASCATNATCRGRAWCSSASARSSRIAFTPFGQMRHPPSGGERSLRRAGPRPPPTASRAPAAVYGLCTQQLLEQVENLDRQVRGLEHRMHTVFRPTAHHPAPPDPARRPADACRRHRLEVGSIAQFATAEKLLPTRAPRRASTPAAARPGLDPDRAAFVTSFMVDLPASRPG